MKRWIFAILLLLLPLTACNHYHEFASGYGILPPPPPSSSASSKPAPPESEWVVPEQSIRVPFTDPAIDREPSSEEQAPSEAPAPAESSEPESSLPPESSEAPKPAEPAKPSEPAPVSPPPAVTSEAPDDIPLEPEEDTAPPPIPSLGTPPERDYQVLYDQNAKLVVEEYYLPTIEDEILRLTNEKRESLGLAPLTFHEELRQGARIRSREMYYYNYFEHMRPNGDDWYTILATLTEPYTHASENIAKGSYVGAPGQSDTLLSGSFWQNEWEQSPPHYEAMVDSTATHIGVGFYYVITEHTVAIYSTVLFATL